MRFYIRLILIYTILSLSLLAAGKQPAVILQNVNVVDVIHGKVLQDQTIVVRGRSIERIAAARKIHPQESDTVIDAQGRYAIPGLWDMHVHIAGFNADPKWSASLLSLFIANGVVGVRDMAGDLNVLRSWERKIEVGEAVGPEIIASGRALNLQRKPSVETIVIHNAEEARAAVREQKQAGADFIKVLSGVPRDAFLAAADEARKEHMDIVGHVPNEMTAAEVSDAGMRGIEHLFYSNIHLECSNQESALRERRAAARKKSPPDPSEVDRIAQEIIDTYDPSKCHRLFTHLAKNGTWLTPTLIGLEGVGTLTAESVNALQMQYIPATTAKLIVEDYGLDAAPYFAREVKHDIRMTGDAFHAGVQILAGSDALDANNVPGFSLHRELQLLHQAGLSNLDALRSATIQPARFLRRENAVGSLQAGKLADIVLLDADPLADIRNTKRIHAVMHEGRMIDRMALDELLKKARQQ